MTRDHRRFCTIATVLLVLGYSAEADRRPAHAQALSQLPNFTGAAGSVDASDVRGVRFRYEAGARTYWHVHDGSLVLLIEQGKGRIQIKGQPMRDFGPGEPVYLPANVPHWHGASPSEGLTWVVLSVGGKVTWMEPVSDAEYLGRSAK